MMLTDWLKEKWLKYMPLFICKEMRQREELRQAELAILDEYVRKHELFLTFKGMTVITFTHDPDYMKHKKSNWIAYVENGAGHMVTSYGLGKTKLAAKYNVIEKYYRKYGKSNV
jgi:hypothetical protein